MGWTARGLLQSVFESITALNQPHTQYDPKGFSRIGMDFKQKLNKRILHKLIKSMTSTVAKAAPIMPWD